jgi:outer membrane lipoprotein-sorting protein
MTVKVGCVLTDVLRTKIYKPKVKELKMKMLKLGFSTCVVLALMLCMVATKAHAITAQEIVDSVIDNLNNVTDYQAGVDVDFDNPNIDDMTDGSLQWKRSSGTWKTKMVEGSPYTLTHISNGSGWNIIDSEEDEGTYEYISQGGYEQIVRYRFGTDMFNMENILDDESWTKADSTETVNSVECYKVYTTKDANDYEVWVDTATVKKVIRTKATDEFGDIQWQLDYSDYSNVESTAQLPATIVTKRYDPNEAVWLTSTYSFSDININENLSDSIFNINTP